MNSYEFVFVVVAKQCGGSYCSFVVAAVMHRLDLSGGVPRRMPTLIE